MSDLQSDKHGEELSSISNQHAVTDARQLFTDSIFNEYWGHVLSTGCDQKLYNTSSSSCMLQLL